MRDLIASCSVGKIDGQIVLDIAGKEDTEGEVDLPIAYYPKRDWITLLQMDGLITKEEFLKAIKLAKKGCMDVYKIQQQALREKYKEVDL